MFLNNKKTTPNPLTRVTQVTPGEDKYGNARLPRERVQAFRVKEDICVAKGTAKENGQFGAGGATQYFVSASERAKLTAGKVRPI